MSNMTDQEVISRAVELADGWKESGFFGCVETPEGYLAVPESSQLSCDALAAQLVRQVDALEREHDLDIARGETWLGDYPARHGPRGLAKIQGPDRTMNTLRAVVESGVLEGKA